MCDARDQIQDLTHARQVLPLSYIISSEILIVLRVVFPSFKSQISHITAYRKTDCHKCESQYGMFFSVLTPLLVYISSSQLPLNTGPFDQKVHHHSRHHVQP